MKKTYKTFDAEYSTAQEHIIPPEHAAPSEEYPAVPQEHFTPSSEYATPPKEYSDTPQEEKRASNKKDKKSLFSKNKLVYFVASAVASFVVFSASLDGGLFGPGNTIGLPDNNHTKPDDSGTQNTEPNHPGGSEEQPSEPDESETQDTEPNKPGSYKGILLTGNFEILGAKNSLIAFYGLQESSYGLMTYEGDLIFKETCQALIKAQGPNAMGYTTFYGCGENADTVEVRDALGKIVYTRTDGRTDISYTQLGDCDIVYELLPQKSGNAYVRYTKLDGTVIFDSRQYTDKKVTGYPFCNGQALIVIDSATSKDDYDTLLVIDYSGNVKKLPNIMPGNASVYGAVDDHFMLRSGSTYALADTATGKISNWLDLKKCAEALGENGNLRFNAAMQDHFATYHYDTRAILSEKYIIDFNNVTPEGTLSSVVQYDQILSLTLSPYILAGTADYNTNAFHFVDWKGNVLSSFHSLAVDFNDHGYAMASDNDTDLIYVYDSNFNIVETLSGVVFTKDYGDFTSIALHNAEVNGGYYYYGDLTPTNTKYLGPIARHAGSKITTEIPPMDPIQFVGIDNQTQLQTVSEQLTALRKALDTEANSNIADRNEIVTSIKELLTSAETLYYVVCTDNACMKNYSDMQAKSKYTSLGYYYITDLIATYENKQSFPSYYSNYLSHHLKTAPAALETLLKQKAFLQDKELTELQAHALTVATDLVQIFQDNKSNLEQLFRYTEEYAQAPSTAAAFLTPYEKNKIGISTYWELIPQLNE